MEFHTALKSAMECMDISDMKPKQIDAIKSFVSSRDTFVTLPTGYGKSIIFTCRSTVLPDKGHMLQTSNPTYSHTDHEKYCNSYVALNKSSALINTR